jgi:hypothetical protein
MQDSTAAVEEDFSWACCGTVWLRSLAAVQNDSAARLWYRREQQPTCGFKISVVGTVRINVDFSGYNSLSGSVLRL